eukprot:IDg17897t1
MSRPSSSSFQSIWGKGYVRFFSTSLCSLAVSRSSKSLVIYARNSFSSANACIEHSHIIKSSSINIVNAMQSPAAANCFIVNCVSSLFCALCVFYKLI